MRSGRFDNSERGLSPVVGASLLLVIAVLLISVSAVMFLDMADRTPPAPTSDLRLEPVNGSEYQLKMEGGDTLDGDRIRVQGIENPNILQGKELTAGDSVRVKPITEDVRITWEEQKKNGVSYVLHTFNVNPIGTGTSSDGTSSDTDTSSDSTSSGTSSDGVVLTTNSGGDLIQITGDGGTVKRLLNSSNVKAIGAFGSDVTGDGKSDIPFVTTDREIKVTNSDGNVTELLGKNEPTGYQVGSQKTRVTTGRWDGSDQSVFFVTKNHDAIYRVSTSGSTKVVSTGAQSVIGTGDIDDDGTDELVFSGSSQTVKYLEANGDVETTGVTAGSSTGIGTGTLADFTGNGQVRVSVVDGSNNIQLVDNDGGTKIATGGMEKSPTAAADVDGDNNPEIIYIGKNNQKIKYIDDVGGANKEKTLKDEDGNDFDGSANSGTA